MRAFAKPAGKRIGNEFPVKKGIQSAIDRVVRQPVAHRGLMDDAGLWVINLEFVI